MPTTKLNDIINPQVMGDMIEAKIAALNKITRIAKVDNTLVGVPGDTKTVPMWNYGGDAQEFNPENVSGDEIPVDKLTASTTTFTVKCAAKAYGILQTAVNSGLGDPIGQAVTQIAKGIAGKLDTDLITAAYGTTNIVTASAPINYGDIVTAVCSFKDEEIDIEKAMYIHPEQEEKLLKDSSFLSADKFEAGVAINGSIGKIAGCWIRKSKKVKHIKYVKDNTNGTITIVSDATTEDATNLHLGSVVPYTDDTVAVGDKVKAPTGGDYYKDLIIKLEPDSPETEYTEEELPALTIFLKKDTQVDYEWFPRKQEHIVTGAKYYGAALTNPAKVVILNAPRVSA